jgi:predicted DNA-binding protein YlxM (UPF0122 family)
MILKMELKKSNKLYWETHPDWDLGFKEFEDEEFKPIQGCEGQYFISNYGKVVSFKNNMQPHLLCCLAAKGVLLVTLFLSKYRKVHRIHRLVYSHFVRELKPQQWVIHKNKISTDNYYKNLEVVNSPELVKDGGAKKHKKRKPDKLKWAEILQFTNKGKFLREYSSMTEAEKDLGIDHKAIYRCLKGKQKSAGGYQWRYRVDPNFDDRISDIPPVPKRKDIKGEILYQFGLDGTFIRAYPSVSEAGRQTSVPRGSIFSCIGKKFTNCTGYQWRLARDPLFKNGMVKIPPVEVKRILQSYPVVQYNMEGKFIREYSSIKKASQICGILISTIMSCIKGKTKTGRQYQWRLKQNITKDGKIVDIEPVKKKPGIAVCQFGVDGKFIREYLSMAEVAKKIGVSKNIIHVSIQKKIKTAAGYQWRKKEEVLKRGKIKDIEPVSHRKAHKGKTVYQFSMEGKFIREYSSFSEAARKNSVSNQAIVSCIKRKNKKCVGCYWRLKDDPDFKNGITDIAPYERKKSKKKKTKKIAAEKKKRETAI